MKTAIQTIVLFLVAAGLAFAGGYEAAGKAGPYNVVATFDQAKPVEGKNKLRIAVTDSASQPVKDAKVDIEYLMPSLPGKPPMMDYHTVSEPSGDGYGATLNLTMKGQWKAFISVTRRNSTEKMAFDFVVK
jgi:hypothetical protein